MFLSSRVAFAVSTLFVLGACSQSKDGTDSIGAKVQAVGNALVPAAHAAGNCEKAADPTCDCAGKHQAAADDAEDTTARVNVPLGSAPVLGAADAKVTVVVYSDFQCPFCAKTTPVLEELQAAYPGKVRIAYKQRPLPFHEHAKIAAKAALAAQEQGKFWEMHDLLTKNPGALTRTDLERYAASLKLDLHRFGQALDDKALDARIEAEGKEADTLMVKGTPTTFINGRRVIGAQGREAFDKVIREELGLH